MSEKKLQKWIHAFTVNWSSVEELKSYIGKGQFVSSRNDAGETGYSSSETQHITLILHPIQNSTQMDQKLKCNTENYYQETREEIWQSSNYPKREVINIEKKMRV